MFFLFLMNADIELTKLGKLIWRSNDIAEILPIINWVELIGKREFAKIDLDDNSENFVLHIDTPKAEVSTHPATVAQIAALK